jgi:response regulator RpfG family c-di-GMP phosphodiesterase
MENRPYNVLLVGDYPPEMKLYQRTLEQAVTANNGRRALEVQGPALDLIISDTILFGMDGVELLKEIGEIYQGKMPFMFYTSFANHKDNFMTWQADEFLVKSDNLAELTSAAKRVIEKHGEREPQLERYRDSNSRVKF